MTFSYGILVKHDHFPFNEITIFHHIAPIENPIKYFLYYCKRCFLIGKSPFSVASPPSTILCVEKIQSSNKYFLYHCKRCFLIGKSPFSVASPPSKSLCRYNSDRRAGRDLCVDQIQLRSTAPVSIHCFALFHTLRPNDLCVDTIRSPPGRRSLCR